MSYETEEERIEREARESRLRQKLISQADPYPWASNKCTVRVGNHLFSPHWLLAYAQARQAGIACVITANYYAVHRTYYQNHHVVYQNYAGPVLLALDYELLYKAHLLRSRKHRVKKDVRELVPA